MRLHTSLVAVLTSMLFASPHSAVAAGNWEPLPESAPAPADNPTTAPRVELGKMLYFDPSIFDRYDFVLLVS